jgi:hypothetical protein
MKGVLIALLAAVFVALCGVGYELSRVADDFQLGADLRTAIKQLANQPRPETPRPAAVTPHKAPESESQRIDRLARERIASEKHWHEVATFDRRVDERYKQLKSQAAASSSSQ